MKRLPGLTLVATTAILLGLAQIVVSLAYFGADALEAAWLRGDMGGISAFAADVMGVGLIAVGIGGMVFGIAAMRPRMWAWPLGVGIYLLAIAGAIFMLFLTQTSVVAAVSGVVSALIVWYLSTEDARAAFDQEIVHHGRRPHAV